MAGDAPCINPQCADWEICSQGTYRCQMLVQGSYHQCHHQIWDEQYQTFSMSWQFFRKQKRLNISHFMLFWVWVDYYQFDQIFLYIGYLWRYFRKFMEMELKIHAYMEPSKIHAKCILSKKTIHRFQILLHQNKTYLLIPFSHELFEVPWYLYIKWILLSQRLAGFIRFAWNRT